MKRPTTYTISEFWGLYIEIVIVPDTNESREASGLEIELYLHIKATSDSSPLDFYICRIYRNDTERLGTTVQLLVDLVGASGILIFFKWGDSSSLKSPLLRKTN